MKSVSISSPSGEGGELFFATALLLNTVFPLVLLQVKAVSGVVRLPAGRGRDCVSISSPSGEGGELLGKVMNENNDLIFLFPLVLLQVKAVREEVEVPLHILCEEFPLVLLQVKAVRFAKNILSRQNSTAKFPLVLLQVKAVSD
jgi:hypothetical protein